MTDRITEVEGDRDNCLYAKIGLVYSQTWPGQVYLRFSAWNEEASTMIRVMPGDIVGISNLAGPYESQSDVRDQILREIADMKPDERDHVLSAYRHPSGR